jgi:hypothetical protein
VCPGAKGGCSDEGDHLIVAMVTGEESDLEGRKAQTGWSVSCFGGQDVCRVSGNRQNRTDCRPPSDKEGGIGRHAISSR